MEPSLRGGNLPSVVVEAVFHVEQFYEQVLPLQWEEFQRFLKTKRAVPRIDGCYLWLPLPLFFFHLFPNEPDPRYPEVRTADSRRRRGYEVLLGVPELARSWKGKPKPPKIDEFEIDAYLLVYSPKTARASIIALTTARQKCRVPVRTRRAEQWMGEFVLADRRCHLRPRPRHRLPSASADDDQTILKPIMLGSGPRPGQRQQAGVQHVPIKPIGRLDERPMSSDEMTFHIGSILAADGVLSKTEMSRLEEVRQETLLMMISNGIAAEKTSFDSERVEKDLLRRLARGLEWPFPGSLTTYIETSIRRAASLQATQPGAATAEGYDDEAGCDANGNRWVRHQRAE